MSQNADGRHRNATEDDAHRDQSCVRIVKNQIDEAAEIHVQEVARGMRLVNARIEALQSQGEIDRVDVIEVVAPE